MGKLTKMSCALKNTQPVTKEVKIILVSLSAAICMWGY